MDWTGYPSASDVQPCAACGDVNGAPCSSCGYQLAGMEPHAPPRSSETYAAWKRETDMQVAEWDAAAHHREEYE